MSGQQGREVVIVEAVRTPVGRGHLEKGYYKDTHPADLLGKTYTEVLTRAGVDPAEVEDVIAGCVQQFGEQAFNIGAALIAAGVHDVVIGSGVEHMGHISFADGAATQQQYGNAFTPKL